MKKHFRTLLLGGVTLLFFALIFRKVDVGALLGVVKTIQPLPLGLALAYFLVYPIVGIERWRRMIGLKYRLPFGTAGKIYFIGETLNLILPSKAGDLSKAYFLKAYRICPASFGASSVVFEKLLDLFALCFALTAGFVLREASDHALAVGLAGGLFLFALVCFLQLDRIRWIERLVDRARVAKLRHIYDEGASFIRLVRERNAHLLFFVGVSILFWAGHMFQVWLFFLAARVPLSYADVLFFVPLAIFASLVPITIAGFGTRDVTFLALLASFAPPENILAGSLLFSLRYFIPALFGVVFVNDFLVYLSERKKLRDAPG